MDVLLGRGSRTSKIKSLSKLAISRIAILRRRREARSSHARSDVIELLNSGYQEHALLRAEFVIKEQNMLDVFLIIEAYCHVLVQKISLVKKHKKFPDELREAIASLIYAASRCGEFPELQELRRIITKKYDKEVTAPAVELPSNYGVNPKKLSTRQPSFDSRLMALKEIASANGISLHLESINQFGYKHGQPEMKFFNKNIVLKDETRGIPIGEVVVEVNVNDSKYYGSRSPIGKYWDVADAAQDAFESAAYAAAAARAAIALSRSEVDDPGHHRDSNQGLLSRDIPRTGNYPRK